PASGRPAASTPASASIVDPALQFETGLQRRLLKDGILLRPGPDASPTELKAYDYVLEAKKNESSDAQALHLAAQRLWEEKKLEREKDRKERQDRSREKARVEREKWQEQKKQKELELPPEAVERHRNNPKPAYETPPPGLVEDPGNPVPEPPENLPPPRK